MGVSYKKDGNRVDMGIKIGTVLSSEVWNIQVKSIKKGFWKDLDRLRKLYEVSLCIGCLLLIATFSFPCFAKKRIYLKG